MPIVLVIHTVDTDDVNAAIVDEEFAMRSTLDHLTDANHQQIAHIAGPQQTSTGFQRATFFANYMRLHTLDANHRFCFNADASMSGQQLQDYT